MMDRTRPLVAFLPFLMLTACSGMFSERTAEVRLATNPPGAKCVLEGADGFSREVATPVRLVMPVAASPVDVTCQHPGFHPSYGRMEIADQGWVMRNGGSAIVGLGADGLSLVGIDVGKPDDGEPKETDYSVSLPPVTPRSVLIRQRNGGQETLVSPQ